MLEWSRSQSNQINYKPEVIDLRDLTEDVCSYLKHSADLKRVILINSVDEKHMVYTDFNMVLTGLRNLVSNATKFSFISKPVVNVSEDTRRMMKIIVVNEGTGMDQETVGRLFEIDKTFSRPGTDNENGTGPGLLICKEFKEKNQGSTFWFILPQYTDKGK